MASSKTQTSLALVHNFDRSMFSAHQSIKTESPACVHMPANGVEKQRTELATSATISIASEKVTMGNATPKSKVNTANFTELDDRQIDSLVATTKFSAQQVLEWHQSFIRECPSGRLNQKQFIKVYQQFYPQGKASKFCSLAFKAFDQDKNGFVDFNEFLTAIALTMSSEPKDRLNLAFSMYDINGDGVLDKKEIVRVMKLIYEVNGKKNVKQEIAPDVRARAILDKFDTNGDRKLSREEFIAGCLNDSELRKLLTP